MTMRFLVSSLTTAVLPISQFDKAASSKKSPVCSKPLHLRIMMTTVLSGTLNVAKTLVAFPRSVLEIAKSNRVLQRFHIV